MAWRNPLPPKQKQHASILKIPHGEIDQYYVLTDEIGRGTFSTVYLGVEKTTGTSYAIKCVTKSQIKEKLLEREIDIMTKLRHKNILFCKEVFEDSHFIYLVLELVKGGELYDKVAKEGEFSEGEAKEIVVQIVSAIEYLHLNGIAHRDLKPENILCLPSENKSKRVDSIKVADFGLAKMFTLESLLSQCGSPTYVAPEVLMAEHYGEAVDMWALGVITYVLLTAQFPFWEEDTHFSALYEKIINVEYSFPENPRLSSEAKSFISHLLVKDIDKRYGPAQCRKHPWLKSVYQKIRENAKESATKLSNERLPGIETKSK